MKDKIIVFLFITYIIIFSILHISLKDMEISNSERRYFESFPEFKLTGKFITDVDEYLLDHFPLRDKFRSIKANFNYKVLGKLDNNGIYLKDNYIFKSDYPLNKKSIDYFINNINKLKSNFSDENKVYLLTIPDKNYYVNEDLFLNIDYDYIYDELSKLDLNFIDVREILELNDYYETDTHWKQENLGKVVNALVTNMGYEYKMVDYEDNEYDKFYGVYYGESAIKRNPEVLKYLINEEINKVKVEHLESGKSNKVYNTEKLIGMDSYDVYLDGATAYIEITNDNTKSKKELIIFRDSFGSSLAPLLIPYYKKITIIDNRYINSDYYLQKVDFKKQDVLFVYSTLIANNSFTLKN